MASNQKLAAVGVLLVIIAVILLYVYNRKQKPGSLLQKFEVYGGLAMAAVGVLLILVVTFRIKNC